MLLHYLGAMNTVDTAPLIVRRFIAGFWDPKEKEVCMRCLSIVTRNRTCVHLPRLLVALLVAAVILSAPFQSRARAEVGPGFPDPIFAPYVDVCLWPPFSLQDAYAQTGQKYFTLAFVVSDVTGSPSWGGYYAMEDNWFMDQINYIRGVGGDVILSFGGASGTELALAIDNVADLQAAYQSVIDRYGLKWVDFDIEGWAVAERDSIDRRNKAIQGLQAANPELKVAFCLPVLPQGLTADGLYVLENARDNGVRIDLVNVMAMDYGDSPAPDPEGQMGRYAIDAAVNTRAQAQTLGIDTRIGITPMIGQNDVPSERFYVSDAVEVLTWAQDPARQPWVGLLSFWSINRDNGGCPGGAAQPQCSGIAQTDFEFTNTWFGFTGEVSIVSPDIQANGSDGPVTISAGDPVSIDIALDPGDRSGVDAEWWVVAQTKTSFGMFPQYQYYAYRYPSGWLAGILPCIETPLMTLNPTNVLTSTLPPGEYAFFFVLDDVADGIPEGKWVDSVKITVE